MPSSQGSNNALGNLRIWSSVANYSWIELNSSLCCLAGQPKDCLNLDKGCICDNGGLQARIGAHSPGAVTVRCFELEDRWTCAGVPGRWRVNQLECPPTKRDGGPRVHHFHLFPSIFMTLTTFTETHDQPQVMELTSAELAELHGGRIALLKRVVEGVVISGIYDGMKSLWSSRGSGGDPVTTYDAPPGSYFAA